jgi:biopolymer transport protein ExbD
MSFGTQDDTSEVMNEINMTPLVDVMLVLLRATNQVQSTPPQIISLSVDAQGDYYWNQDRISDTSLPAMLQAEALKTPQPDLHIRGDKAVRYERVAQVMAAAQQAGIKKIGFITEPRN